MYQAPALALLSTDAFGKSVLNSCFDICIAYCRKFCLKFNVGKTKVMVFGKINKSLSSLSPVVVNGEPVVYVGTCRYLGFHIIAGNHLKFSINEDLRGFFGSVNSILSSVQKPKENILMQLLYSNCVPKLTYGAAVKDLTAADRNHYSVALNNAIRRIFGFRYWQSIRQLREFFGFDSIEVIFAKAKKRFHDSMVGHRNGVLRLVGRLSLSEIESSDLV